VAAVIKEKQIKILIPVENKAGGVLIIYDDQYRSREGIK